MIRLNIFDKQQVIFLAYCAFLLPLHCLPAQVADLPAPPNGIYEQTFKYKIGSVIPADLNGDGRLDFVSRTQYVGKDSLIWLEFRLNGDNSEQPLWEFNTQIVCEFKSAPQPVGRVKGRGYSKYLDVPSIAWDWDGDDRWEVYFAYYDPGQNQWRHRIVNGQGATLADAALPSNCNFESRKVMVALCKYNGVNRIVIAEDGMESGGVSMYETRDDAGNWSLNQLWFYDAEDVISHDMIRTADVDLNGSDDEILLGGAVLNANGSERYTMDEKLNVSGFGRGDQVILGFFDPARPNELVMICGDDYVGGDWNTYVAAVYARTGEVIFKEKMSDWTHWHSGWAKQTAQGVEILAKDRDSDKWARFEITNSFAGLVSRGDGNAPSGYYPLKWNDNDIDVTEVSGKTGSGARVDLGGSGSEEIIEHRSFSPENVLRITFNQNSDPGFPSRWQNEQYRKDAMLLNSGYAPYWLGALVISTNESDKLAPKKPENVNIRIDQ